MNKIAGRIFNPITEKTLNCQDLNALLSVANNAIAKVRLKEKRLAIIPDDVVVAAIAPFLVGQGHSIVLLDPQDPIGVLISQLKVANPALVIAPKRYVSDLRDSGFRVATNIYNLQAGDKPKLDTPMLQPALGSMSGGTTGTSKLMLQKLKGMAAGYQNLILTTGMNQKHIVGCFNKAPTHGHRGYMTYSALLCGATVIGLPTDGDSMRKISDIVSGNLKLAPNMVSLAPSLWKLISEDLLQKGPGQVDVVRWFSGLMSDDTFDIIQDVYNGKYLVSGIGMTELCHVGSGHRPGQSSATAANDLGFALPNTEIVMLNQQQWGEGHFIPFEGEGQGIPAFSGDNVVEGYEGNPEKTKAAFLSHGDRKFYVSNDFFSRDESGRYFFVGRQDDYVQVNDYNIWLAYVDSASQNAPGVKDAAASATKDGADQAVIQITVVVDPDFNTDSFERYLRENLPHYALPQDIIVAETIPKNAKGVVQRHLL